MTRFITLFLTKELKRLALSSVFISKQIFFWIRKNNKKYFISQIKTTLSFIIAFQLAVHPYAMATSNLTQKQDKNLELAKQFNEKHVESLRDFIFNSDKDSKDYYKNHSLDTFSLLGQEVNKVNHDIDVKNLFMQIIEDTEEKKLRAILSHQDKALLVPKLLVLTPAQSDAFTRYTFNSKSISTKEKLTFQLSYHDKIIHTFPQNIQWAAFIGSYLVFLEPSKVSNNKALISFIDLNHFKKAIGKTSLPLFYLPVHFKKSISKESITSPKNIEITKDNHLLIGEMKISLNQIDYISKLQQLNFNTTVTLIDPANADLSKDFLKKIVNNFEDAIASFSQEESTQSKKVNLKTKKIILKFLKNRKKIGSAKDISGNYGKLNTLEANLALASPDHEITKEFTESLKADKAFQQAVQEVHNETIAKRKFWNRQIAFLNNLTRPQPLGSPKITKALGLIVNSVIKKDTIKDRFLIFKEALSQTFYSNTNRYLTMSVLAGMGLVASPAAAQYSIGVLNSIAGWSGQWLELTTVTLKASFQWVDANALYKSYFEGNKPVHLLKGLTSLFAIVLMFLGVLHFGANVSDLIKNLKIVKEIKHQKEVDGLFKRFKNNLKNFRSSFIQHMEKNRTKFIEDLSNADQKKLGTILHLKIGFKDIHSRQILKTLSSPHTIYEVFSSKENLSLQITAENKQNQTVILDLKSQPKNPADKALEKNEISISTTYSQKTSTRVFSILEGNIENLLTDKNSIDSDLSMNINFSGKKSHISGILQNADFSEEEESRIVRVIKEIEDERKKNHWMKSKKIELSSKEITTLKQSLSQLALGYSSWAKTFRTMGLFWNWFFFSRSIYVHPGAMARMLYYSKYFEVAYRNKHNPTFFNGGEQSRFNRLATVYNTKKMTKGSIKNSLNSMEEFENEIIELERKYLEEVTAQSYLELVKKVGKNPEKEIAVLAHGPKNFNNEDIKIKKNRIFYGIYKRDLFEESMKDHFSSLLDVPQNTDNKTIKAQLLAQFLKDKDPLSKDVTKKEVRDRVLRVAKEHNIAQKSQEVIDNLIKGFTKRFTTSGKQTSRNSLNPKKSIFMQRMSIAERLLNDSEGLARATRQQVSNLLVDLPIDILYTFIFLAGVDQGILKLLHEQAFTEEAWFHLSRYVIWSGFFMNLAIGTLAGVWNKVQMDNRLDEMHGFDVIPDKGDVTKKLGFIRWLKKQMGSKDNGLMENYKYYWKIVFANIPAAFLTMSIIFLTTLGRFDLELYASIYLMALLPFGAFGFKLENAFEKSINFSLKDFIKKDVDFNGKDRHLLSHPKIQNFKIRESGKLRKKYNLWLAVLFNNPLGNILEIFSNIDTSIGSRAFTRLFFGGNLLTEYWVNFVDFLEEKSILSSEFSEKCKNIFTNNRTDI